MVSATSFYLPGLTDSKLSEESKQ